MYVYEYYFLLFLPLRFARGSDVMSFLMGNFIVASFPGPTNVSLFTIIYLTLAPLTKNKNTLSKYIHIFFLI